MGTFTHPITLIGPAGQRETLEALVDTGATFTTMPTAVLERLGVRPHRRARLRLANGQVEEVPLGTVRVQLDGMEESVPCVFGRPQAPPTIGAVTLEIFLLAADPVRQRLVPTEGFLLATHPVKQRLVPNEALLVMEMAGKT